MKRWLGLGFLILILTGVSYLASYFSVQKTKENIVPERIERIVSLNVAATQILCDLGLEDKIVGVSFSEANPQNIKDKPKVGRGFGNVNIEVVLALKPNIVFTHKGDAQILKEKGIPVFVVDTCNLEQVINLVSEIGKVVNREREAEEITSKMEKRINEIAQKITQVKSKPLVYYEAGDIGRTRGPGSLTHDLITLAGGENLAKDQPIAFPLLSNEYIIARNLDIIIVEEYGASIEEIKKRDGWQEIKAVKDNRIFRSPVYYTNYTPSCIEGLEQFARWFHPEVFEE